ncbi:MAG: DUF4113 domain-containing protein [Candidatus Cloacimonetes bacterium]|nr:DUF4113 domain-containing protein [Candidatus Cloacimonadota bacterium]
MTENNLLNHRIDDTISNLFHCKIYTFLPRPFIRDDECINKMGSHKITYASAGIKKPWQMKRERTLLPVIQQVENKFRW